jgi:diguanylate cyclase (GGDEF)-like protein
MMGRHAFDLVSIEGRLIEQVHEPNQDTLFVNSRGHVFSTILRHPGQSGTQLPPLRIDSYVRATGVCFVTTGGPWKGALEFELHMRDARDVQVLAGPPWWTVAHMVYVIRALGVVVFAALVWGTVLRRRVHQQTQLIHRAMQEEAVRVRRRAALEKDRSRILEAINNRAPLAHVLRMISDLISQQAQGLECWCEIVEDTRDTKQPSAVSDSHECRQEIVSGTGERLGAIVLAWSVDKEPGPACAEVLERGANLAALAIDNRRLYEHLVRRSEYDQLTDVPNRFFLESCLEKAFACARENGRSFALIFIDLDRFKFVNDRYGHRIGDIYLQTVARRLAENLRDQDTLARVGGDEFIVLIPEVRDRGEAEEIALRIDGCFATPFRIDGHSIQGSASIGVALYPQDGIDEDQLKRSADFAMYVSKQRVIEWE